ncbi:MAG: right-handed parallel beta-helix repeat-containing protein [Promethearchaeota archaeon]
MTEMRKSKIYILLLLIGLFSSVSLLFNLNSFQTNITDEDDPKTSGYWVMGTLHIDDNGGGDYNWTEAVAQPWCSGNGSILNPYILENITIDAGNVDSPIFIENSNVYFVIENCTLTNSQATGVDAGIKFEDVYNGKIIENNITDNYAGVKLIRSDNNSILSNHIYDNTGQGIVLQSSENNLIEGNIANNSWYYGLIIHSFSHNNTVEGNTFGNNKGISNVGSGIRIYRSSDCEVSRNLLCDNDQGIRIIDNSHGNEFYDNIIHNNAKYGVLIQDLTQNCNDSVFYNNSISNPAGINAYDNGTNTIWNLGTLGNYWNDYDDDDDDDDGIGDTPYLISGDANSQDNYPIWEDGDDIYPTFFRNSPSAPLIFGASAPVFNLTLFDLNLHMAWYKINQTYIHFFTPVNGINIVTLDQTSWDALPEGNLSIGFFINDTAGNLLTAGLAATKDLPPEEPPSTPGIPYGHFYLIFLGLGILSLIFVQIKRGKYKLNINF